MKNDIVKNKITKLQVAWEMVKEKTNVKFTPLQLTEYIRTRHPEINRPKTFANSVNRTLGDASGTKRKHFGLSYNLHLDRDENVSPYEYWFYRD